MVEERLAVARRLFKQFDVERKGYLTEKQVPNLLKTVKKLNSQKLRDNQINNFINQKIIFINDLSKRT